jgi:ABC-2 type transport system permease protein
MKIRYKLILFCVFFVTCFLIRAKVYTIFKEYEIINTNSIESKLSPEGTVGDIVQGRILNQRISIPNIPNEYLSSINLLIGTNNRINDSKLFIDLLDENGDAIGKYTFNVNTIPDNSMISLPLETNYNSGNILIRISSDASAEQAVTLWKSHSKNYETDVLNDSEGNIGGSLCYWLEYKSYGLSYYKFLIVYCILIVIVYFFILILFKLIKDYINLFANMKTFKRDIFKFKYLLRELVVRDIKVKYKRSILGMLWSILSPLLMMLIMNLVFSTIFKSNIDNFPLYLMIGQVTFNFFSEATNTSMTSVLSNIGLLTKAYIPKYIFPLSKVFTALVNLGFQLIALLAVMYFTHTPITVTMILFPLVIIYTSFFAFGISLILSALTVFFRDIIYLYGIVLLAWTYLTPIFYPIDIMPTNVSTFIKLNPMYNFIEFGREVLLYGQIPSISLHLTCIFYSIFAMFIGIIVFYKKKEKFILFA